MADKRIFTTNFHGDPNVGLHGLATDKFCLLGRGIMEKDVTAIEKILQVPVFQIGLYGTDLIGLFAVATSSKVLLPDIVFPNELKSIREKLSKIGIQVDVINVEHTALGNNILINDKSGIISAAYDKKAVAQIKKIFPEVKFEQLDIGGLSVPGSVGKVTNKGGIFSPNISDADIKKIESLFGFEIGLGTVNLGNPFVSSGILANSTGMVMGSLSSGYELSRAFESLGFFSSLV